MCYSFDVIKKMAFEKEIEHIKSERRKQGGPEKGSIIVDYMEHRIKEIEAEYGEPMVRDF